MAILLLIFLSPLILIVSVALYVNNNGVPLFIQERPGLNTRIFSLIKFKTMTDAVDNNGKLLSDADRLTPLGKWVRDKSLDEIPQLINVLKGEMSFVGPRPLLKEYLPYYNKYQLQRHNMKPGITGWAQVNGRNTLTWEEKFDYDVYYINNVSFNLDFKIILLTIKKVLSAQDVSSSTSLTMEDFRGPEFD